MVHDSPPHDPVPAPASQLAADAEMLFGQGRLAEAADCLEQALRLTPGGSGRAELLSDLAVVAARAGDIRHAVRLAGESLALDPDRISALEVIEFCAREREQRSSALASERQLARIREFEELSSATRVTGVPLLTQPVVMHGSGIISFGSGVRFGWLRSPGFHSTYGYIEAGSPHSRIEIGDNSFFNNGATLRSEGPGVSVGADCLFGWGVQIVDSDFHEVHPGRRLAGQPATAHVDIGDNVFVGAGSLILKGVSIGRDTVVGAGSVVTRSLPAGVIAAGNPARIIGELDR